MKMSVKKLCFLALMTSLAMVLSYIEMLLPPVWPAVPGIKVGFANIVIILLLYKFSFKEAGVVSLVRVCLMSLLFGSAVMFLYSLGGAVLSLVIMAVLKRTDWFSSVGVSIAGGVTHNLGQIIVAIIVMQTKEIGYYMIILAITGTIAGIFIGLLGAILLRYFKKLRL